MRGRRRVDVAMLLLVVVWGVNFPIIKVAFGELPPFVFNGLRFAVAAACLVGISRWRDGPWRIEPGDVPGLALLGLIGHAGYQSLFIAGLARTTASHSSIILSLVPLFVGVLGVALGIERPSLRMWAGLLLAFAGVVVLVRSRTGLGGDGATLAGDLITLAGALCWAAYTVLSRPWLARYSALRLTTVTLSFGLPVILASAADGLVRIDWRAVSPQAWGALAFSSLFAVVVSYVIWYSSVQAVGSARTAAFSNLIPIVALLSAWVMLREPMGVPQIAGTAVVLFGVWLARSGRPLGQPRRVRSAAEAVR
ncbi:MAG: DMT family transporter [Armatimonadota bacterium]|nr:DMT family transporter [Armatimonadota bacterium]